MAKKEQKDSLGSDKVDQGKKPSTKTPKNEGKLSSPKRKKLIAGLLVILLVAVAIGAAVVLMSRDSGESGEITEEPALTYAEELEQYSLDEAASQDDYNSQNLSIALAHYQEGNFDRTLELLEAIIDPDDAIIDSYNELFGLVLNALGRSEEAQAYLEAAVAAHEEFLLESANTDPVAYYNLGILYGNASMNEKAIQSYQSFIQVAETTPELIEGLDEETLSETIELAKEAIEGLQ